MGKMAFLFAGQGAQYVGMGETLYENYEEARKIFDQANLELDVDITNMCFEGPNEELMKTENTQPAVLTMDIAVYKILESLKIKPDVVAGLSLGEYAALIAAGAMSFEEGVKLVKKRGRFMQEAVPQGLGKMAAIMGIEKKLLAQILESVSIYGIAEAANYNYPGQIVISGETSPIEKACELVKENGGKAVVLPVSAPFHCTMLKPAGELLEKELEDIEITKINIPVISNVTADYYENKDSVKSFLVKQVSQSVLWEDTLLKMFSDDVDVFVELGPGKTLTQFVKKTAKKNGQKVTTYNIEDQKSLEDFLEKFSVR